MFCQFTCPSTCCNSCNTTSVQRGRTASESSVMAAARMNAPPNMTREESSSSASYGSRAVIIVRLNRPRPAVQPQAAQPAPPAPPQPVNQVAQLVHAVQALQPVQTVQPAPPVPIVQFIQTLSHPPAQVTINPPAQPPVQFVPPPVLANSPEQYLPGQNDVVLLDDPPSFEDNDPPALVLPGPGNVEPRRQGAIIIKGDGKGTTFLPLS